MPEQYEYNSVPRFVAVTAKFTAATENKPVRLRLRFPRSATMGSTKVRRRVIDLPRTEGGREMSATEIAADYIKDIAGITPVGVTTATNPLDADTVLYDWYEVEEGVERNNFEHLGNTVFCSGRVQPVQTAEGVDEYTADLNNMEDWSDPAADPAAELTPAEFADHEDVLGS